MPVYAIGDVHGCLVPFERLLERLNFDPAADELWLTGDLINRGPDSAGVLRMLRGLGGRAHCVLGNHDLYGLAVHMLGEAPTESLRLLYEAPDCAEALDWLRHRPLVHHSAELRTLIVHAGVYPGWTLETLLALASEVTAELRGERHPELFARLYGDEPACWAEDLSGAARWRFIINACTRMRFCDAAGALEFKAHGSPGEQPSGWLPWFEHPQAGCPGQRIVFGHWASLGLYIRPDLIALDSGCAWGRQLSAVRLDAPQDMPPHWQVPCGAPNVVD